MVLRGEGHGSAYCRSDRTILQGERLWKREQYFDEALYGRFSARVIVSDRTMAFDIMVAKAREGRASRVVQRRNRHRCQRKARREYSRSESQSMA